MLYALAVGIGGFIGAILRYVLTGWVQQRFPAFPPAGTLVVNALGCLCIGFLMTMVADQALLGNRPTIPHSLRLFLITGILGSLTTFSAFGFETVELLREHELRWAFWNVTANLSMGLAAVWLGHGLAKVLGW